jgi:hypothetical protein
MCVSPKWSSHKDVSPKWSNNNVSLKWNSHKDVSPKWSNNNVSLKWNSLKDVNPKWSSHNVSPKWSSLKDVNPKWSSHNVNLKWSNHNVNNQPPHLAKITVAVVQPLVNEVQDNKDTHSLLISRQQKVIFLSKNTLLPIFMPITKEILNTSTKEI